MNIFRALFCVLFIEFFFSESTSCFQFPTKKEMLVLCDTCNVVELLLSYDNIYYVKFLANTLFTFFLHWRTVDVKRNNCIFKNELGFQVLHNSLFQLCLGIFFFYLKTQHAFHFEYTHEQQCTGWISLERLTSS